MPLRLSPMLFAAIDDAADRYFTAIAIRCFSMLFAIDFRRRHADSAITPRYAAMLLFLRMPCYAFLHLMFDAFAILRRHSFYVCGR